MVTPLRSTTRKLALLRSTSWNRAPVRYTSSNREPVRFSWVKFSHGMRAPFRG
jgi:hypothetical protein